MSKFFGNFLLVTEDGGKVFRTMLSSSNFALNAYDGNPHILAKMFEGMNVATAEQIIVCGEGRLGRPTRDSIWVPNDLIVEGDNDDEPPPLAA